MATQSVTLTGDGAVGLTPPGAPRRFLSQLPQMVKLGRLTPKSRPQALKFGAYVDKLAIAPPAAVDWYTKAADSIARMYLNDTYGCCVIAGKAHSLGVWSANDADAGGLVLATDNEIYNQYQSVCGRGDNGCYIPDVLDYFKSQGFLAGGKRYKIDGYVSCDWRSKELVQVGLALFGAATIGFSLPNSWLNSAVWDVTASRIVGGHDVTPCGYGTNVLGTNADGVVVSSWGRLYLMTWAAFTSSQYISEMYFMVPSFVWTGADGVAPSGVSLTTLKDDLAKIGNGTIPPLPDPTPPTPPIPPTPPEPMTGYTDPITVTGKILGFLPITLGSPPVKVTINSATGDGIAASHEAFVSKLQAMVGFAPNWLDIVHDAWALYQAIRGGQFDAIAQAVMKLVEDIIAGIQPAPTAETVDPTFPHARLGGLFRRVVAYVRARRAEGWDDDKIRNSAAGDVSPEGDERSLTPEQWGRLIAFVLQIVMMFL